MRVPCLETLGLDDCRIDLAFGSGHGGKSVSSRGEVEQAFSRGINLILKTLRVLRQIRSQSLGQGDLLIMMRGIQARVPGCLQVGINNGIHDVSGLFGVFGLDGYPDPVCVRKDLEIEHLRISTWDRANL